jgi:hypothetical protein
MAAITYNASFLTLTAWQQPRLHHHLVHKAHSIATVGGRKLGRQPAPAAAAAVDKAYVDRSTCGSCSSCSSSSQVLVLVKLLNMQQFGCYICGASLKMCLSLILLGLLQGMPQTA